MPDLTPAERERLHVELAKALGWRMFPYATVGLPDSQQRWCPPDSEVHISTCRDLPSVDELLAALRHERQLRAELEARVSALRTCNECGGMFDWLSSEGLCKNCD
jgi:hypothetical protein